MLNGAEAQSSSEFWFNGTQALVIIKPPNVGFEETMQENIYTQLKFPLFCTLDKFAQRSCSIFSAVSCSVLATNWGLFFFSLQHCCQVTGTTSRLGVLGILLYMQEPLPADVQAHVGFMDCGVCFRILNCIFCTFLNVCLGHFDKIDCVLLMLK